MMFHTLLAASSGVWDHVFWWLLGSTAAFASLSVAIRLSGRGRPQAESPAHAAQSLMHDLDARLISIACRCAAAVGGIELFLAIMHFSSASPSRWLLAAVPVSAVACGACAYLAARSTVRAASAAATPVEGRIRRAFLAAASAGLVCTGVALLEVVLWLLVSLAVDGAASGAGRLPELGLAFPLGAASVLLAATPWRSQRERLPLQPTAEELVVDRAIGSICRLLESYVLFGAILQCSIHLGARAVAPESDSARSLLQPALLPPALAGVSMFAAMLGLWWIRPIDGMGRETLRISISRGFHLSLAIAAVLGVGLIVLVLGPSWVGSAVASPLGLLLGWAGGHWWELRSRRPLDAGAADTSAADLLFGGVGSALRSLPAPAILFTLGIAAVWIAGGLAASRNDPALVLQRGVYGLSLGLVALAGQFTFVATFSLLDSVGAATRVMEGATADSEAFDVADSAAEHSRGLLWTTLATTTVLQIAALYGLGSGPLQPLLALIGCLVGAATAIGLTGIAAKSAQLIPARQSGRPLSNSRRDRTAWMGTLKQAASIGLLPVLFAVGAGPSFTIGLVAGFAIAGLSVALLCSVAGAEIRELRGRIAQGAFGGPQSPMSGAAEAAERIGKPFTEVAATLLPRLAIWMNLVALAFAAFMGRWGLP